MQILYCAGYQIFIEKYIFVVDSELEDEEVAYMPVSRQNTSVKFLT